MRWGITFDGRSPVAHTLPVVQAAEAMGFECAWVAEHLGHRDSLLYAAALLERTERIVVGAGAISPFYRHPAHIAMGAATLRERYGPRVRLMLGIGNVDDVKLLRVPLRSVLGGMREATEIVRALLKDGRVDIGGDQFSASGVRMGNVAPAPVPLYLAAIRQRMVRLAGEIADGVSLSAAASPEYVRQAVSQAREAARTAGREEKALDVTCNIIACIAAGRGEALTKAKRQLGWILAGGNEYLFQFQPYPVDKEAVRRALHEDDTAALDRLIPDGTAEALAVATTPAELGSHLKPFADAGVSLALLRLVGTPAEQLHILKSLER